MTVSLAIAFSGDKSSRITSFDLVCLVVVGLSVVFWTFTQNHLVTNFMILTILVIAYFPVVKRLVEPRVNTEPFLIRVGMLIAPVLSLQSSKGMPATAYSVRAIVCVSTLLVLMAWIDFSGEKKDLCNQEFHFSTIFSHLITDRIFSGYYSPLINFPGSLLPLPTIPDKASPSSIRQVSAKTDSCFTISGC